MCDFENLSPQLKKWIGGEESGGIYYHECDTLEEDV